ncbi:MAG TPA: septal ring lytic transglycosylase RlpA family protein [Thermodesulfobacteriaceae bacterium]|nr:septal ring lytic transglycosylase RlpA family protein [Thermodesulfobacteriaceae bacterium]
MKTTYCTTAILIIAWIVSGCSPGKHAAIRKHPNRPADSAVHLKNLPTQRPYRINGRVYYPLPSSRGFVEQGRASWYGKKFHGNTTSNGETYNMYGISAAHKTLPMNTYVRVTNLDNGREVIVRINDRGPFVKNRIIDLSYGAAQRLSMIKSGTARVRIEALGELDHAYGTLLAFKSVPNFSKGSFFIQVGAFLEARNAYALKRMFEKKYRNVTVARESVGPKTFFKVQLFASTDYDEARKLVSKLESMGHKEAFLVAR